MPLVPRVSWAPFVPESPSDSDIRITADGMIFLESKWFPDSESTAMFQRVAARSLSHAGSRVLLRVDRNVPFGTVRHFLERLRDIGITDATLLVDSENPLAPAPAPNPGMQRTRYARR